MSTLVPKSMSRGVHYFLILLLVALFIPTSSALASFNVPVQDPGFEASYNSSAYWQQSSTNGFVICSTAACGTTSAAKPRTGSNWVWFGGINFSERGAVSPEVGDVYQNVTFPGKSCKATLQFYFWIGEAQTGSDVNDNFRAMVDGNTVFSSNATKRSSYSSYKLVSVDVSPYANGAVRKLEFNSRISGQRVSFNLDDVALVSDCTGVKGDYSGDGKADIAVFRPSASTWYLRSVGTTLWGGKGDIPVPADYNGDGKTDIAIFRPAASTWFIQGVGNFLFGGTGDIPAVGDYNGDHKADMTIFRPSTGTWYISGQNPFMFGWTGDIPVVADYNGDGKDDVAVFRPSNGTWYILGQEPFMFGWTGDIPVPGDYNGDRKADIAVFRPSNGTWYIVGVGTFQFGWTDDIPVQTDYNGDGKADIAVYRPSNGFWYIKDQFNAQFGGAAEDIPVIDYIYD